MYWQMERVNIWVGHFRLCSFKDCVQWCHCEPYCMYALILSCFQLVPALLAKGVYSELIDAYGNLHTCLFNVLLSYSSLAYNTIFHFRSLSATADEKKVEKLSAVYSVGSWNRLTAVTALRNEKSRCSIGHINCDFDCGSWQKDSCHSGADKNVCECVCSYRCCMWGHQDYYWHIVSLLFGLKPAKH